MNMKSLSKRSKVTFVMNIHPEIKEAIRKNSSVLGMSMTGYMIRLHEQFGPKITTKESVIPKLVKALKQTHTKDEIDKIMGTDT